MPFAIKSPRLWTAAAVAVLGMVGITSLSTASAEAGKGAPTASTSPIGALLPGGTTPTCVSPITEPYIGRVGAEGMVTRLYGAYFGRNPDAPGFDFWLQKIYSGEWTNEGTSEFFANSTEFKARFGAELSDADFLNQVYNNALCREPDPGGRAYWLDRMANGLSRGHAVLLISDSQEFRGATGTD